MLLTSKFFLTHIKIPMGLKGFFWHESLFVGQKSFYKSAEIAWVIHEKVMNFKLSWPNKCLWKWLLVSMCCSFRVQLNALREFFILYMLKRYQQNTTENRSLLWSFMYIYPITQHKLKNIRYTIISIKHIERISYISVNC